MINKYPFILVHGIILKDYKFFKAFTKIEKSLNDGLISRKSSKFANYKGDYIEESISHGQIVGFTLSRKKKIKVIEFYLALCKNLMEMGF